MTQAYVITWYFIMALRRPIKSKSENILSMDNVKSKKKKKIFFLLIACTWLSKVFSTFYFRNWLRNKENIARRSVWTEAFLVSKIDQNTLSDCPQQTAPKTLAFPVTYFPDHVFVKHNSIGSCLRLTFCCCFQCFL